ncbi:MAG: hypothetical protein SFZ03_11965 [Candidatus Melainabacteria bacterium]|nr:hypothetical protein [Candidatus Melainabacteria bacterium]
MSSPFLTRQSFMAPAVPVAQVQVYHGPIQQGGQTLPVYAGDYVEIGTRMYLATDQGLVDTHKSKAELEQLLPNPQYGELRQASNVGDCYLAGSLRGMFLDPYARALLLKQAHYNPNTQQYTAHAQKLAHLSVGTQQFGPESLELTQTIETEGQQTVALESVRGPRLFRLFEQFFGRLRRDHDAYARGVSEAELLRLYGLTKDEARKPGRTRTLLNGGTAQQFFMPLLDAHYKPFVLPMGNRVNPEHLKERTLVAAKLKDWASQTPTHRYVATLALCDASLKPGEQATTTLKDIHGKPLQIIKNHAYTIEGVYSQTGDGNSLAVVVSNPHDTRTQKFEISLGTVLSGFNWIVGAERPATLSTGIDVRF